MAQLVRTSKSASNWTSNELYVYNITVVPQISSSPKPDRKQQTRLLLHYLDMAMDPKIGHEAAVINFAAELLKGLNYDDEDTKLVFSRRVIPFPVCGENSIAEIDVRVMDENEILLLLQDDERLTSMNDPEAQVIAAAIAAFALNNRKRERDLNLPAHKAIMLPCLAAQAVQTGSHPETKTRHGVHRFTPVLPRENSEGMRPLSNRLEILRCLKAFKKFMGN